MKLSYLFVYIFCFLGYSQNNLLVEYQYSQNGGDQIFTYSHFLLVDNEDNYYIMPSHKKYERYEDLYTDPDYATHRTRKSIYRKNNNTQIYSFEYLPKSKSTLEEKFVRDNIILDYEHVNTDEIILGYHCKLVKTKFRGRNYKIWYTKDIPVSSGPWKFFGLPGLILKVENDDRLFEYMATRIVLNKEFKIPQTLKNLYINLSSSMEYKEFIKLQNNVFNDFREKAIASLPKNVIISGKTPHLRTDLQEVYFEWEESKKP